MRISNSLWKTLINTHELDDLTETDRSELEAAIIQSKGKVLVRLPNKKVFEPLAVKIIPELIKYTEQELPLCLIAVNESPETIKYIRNVPIDLIRSNPHALQYVRHQTPELCLAAILADTSALQYVHHQTMVLCLQALKIDWDKTNKSVASFASSFMNLANVTPTDPHGKKIWEEIMRPFLDAVNKSANYFRFNTRHFWSQAVEINPYVIVKIQEPEHELCVRAVSIDPYVLACLRRQTLTIIRTAVRICGLVLYHANAQTEEICVDAIMQDYRAVVFVKEQTEWIKRVTRISYQLMLRRQQKEVSSQ